MLTFVNNQATQKGLSLTISGLFFMESGRYQ